MMPLRCFAHFMPPWREDLLFWSICMNTFKFFGTANFNFLNLFFVKFSAHENRFSFLNFSGWPCYYRVPQKKRTFRIIIPVLQSIQAHKPGLQALNGLADVSACRMMILEVRFLGHPVHVIESKFTLFHNFLGLYVIELWNNFTPQTSSWIHQQLSSSFLNHEHALNSGITVVLMEWMMNSLVYLYRRSRTRSFLK